MLNFCKNYAVLGLAVLVLLAGCGIISITYMIDEDFDLVGTGDFYFRGIDVTENPDWQDHEEDIEFVELVAFDIWLTNNEETAITFDGYVDDYANTLCGSRACFDGLSTPTRVLREIVIPAGAVNYHITPGQSLSYIEHLDVMKTLAREGQFNFYGISTGGSSVNFSVDSGRVVIWVMVSASS